ncbi:MAG: hypothetical protein GEV08_24060 [Acidimicrobiia bacterium]|nr:hypothetical protein [Acidimicrobiia bacterium]
MRGARVVEFAASIAGAYCAKLFATTGAEVLTVEGPGGSPLRREAPHVVAADGTMRSARHEYLAAGTRSIVLADGDAALGDVLAWADVVISSSDGGPAAALERHSAVAAANPAAVHVVLSGYGLDGPGELAAQRPDRLGRGRPPGHHRSPRPRAPPGRRALGHVPARGHGCRRRAGGARRGGPDRARPARRRRRHGGHGRRPSMDTRYVQPYRRGEGALG